MDCYILLLSLLPQSAGAFTAYGCSSPDTLVDKYSLIGIAPCPEPDQTYPHSREMHFQVVEQATDTRIPYTRCEILVTRTFERCGIQSTSYGQKYLEFRKPIEVTPNVCRLMASHQAFIIESQVMKPLAGDRGSETFFTAGSLDSDHNCVYGSTMRQGVQHNYGYEQSTYEAIVHWSYGTLDLITRNVTFAGLVPAPETDKVVMDADYGTFILESVKDSCNGELSVIFEGQFTVSSKGRTVQTGSIAISDLSNPMQAVGLVLGEKFTLCGRHAYITNVRRVAVVVLNTHGEGGLDVGFKPYAYSEITRLEATNALVHLTMAQSHEEKIRALNLTLCEQSRKVLQLKIDLIAWDPNPYILRHELGEGTMVTKDGAVISVYRCPKVEASIRSFPNCTQEIPSVINGTDYFVDPVSKISQSYGTIIPCSAISPPMWEIAGTWYCATPDIIPCKEPSEFQPDYAISGPFWDPSKNLAVSAYSDTQQGAHDEYLSTVQSRGPIMNEFVANAYQSRGPSGEIGSPLSIYAQEILAHLTLMKISPLYVIFGAYTFWFLVMFFIGFSGNIIIGTVLRTRMLLRRKVRGPAILTVLWGTLFQLVFGSFELGRMSAAMMKEDMEEETVDDGELAPEDGTELESSSKTKKNRLYPRIPLPF